MQENKKSALIKELKAGEESGFVENFDSKDLLNSLHKIVGAVNLPQDFDEEKELRSALEKKHL